MFPTTRRTFVYIEIKSVDWNGFIKLLKDNTTLAVPKDKPIKKVYTLLDKGEKAYIDDISALESKGKYYIQTENEDDVSKQPKFSAEMEEFFKALKDEEGLEDDDIALVKDAFVKQKLKFKQLMKTGDLAGSGGCNSFVGKFSYELNTLKIGTLAATRKLCVPTPQGQEDKFFKALEMTQSAQVLNGELRLMGAGDTELMLLRR